MAPRSTCVDSAPTSARACAEGACTLSELCKRGCDDGWLVDVATNTARRCACEQEHARERRVRKVLRELPEGLRHVDFERTPIKDFDPEIQGALQRYVKYHARKIKDGRGLWIQGDPGTGKTAAAALIAKKYSERGHTVLMRSVPVLLSDIRGLQPFEKASEWAEMRDQLVELDLLGLDDLGAEVASPWALERLYELINEREVGKRALLVTTNFDPQQLKRRLGWRIVSRLYGICGQPLVMTGPDHRELTARSPLAAEFDDDELCHTAAGMR